VGVAQHEGKPIMTMGDRIRPGRKAEDQPAGAGPTGDDGVDSVETGERRDSAAQEASAPHIEKQALIDAPGS
jgi:hypothetical protein